MYAYDESTGLLTCTGKTWGKPCNRTLQLPQLQPPARWYHARNVAKWLADTDPLLRWQFDLEGQVSTIVGEGSNTRKVWLGGARCPVHRVRWGIAGGIYGAGVYPRESENPAYDALAVLREQVEQHLKGLLFDAYERLGLRVPMLGGS